MGNFLIELEGRHYLVEAPDEIVAKINDYFDEFYEWLKVPKNGHWVPMPSIELGADFGGVSFDETDFVAWLNKYLVKDECETVRIIEKIPPDLRNGFATFEELDGGGVSFSLGDMLPPDKQNKFGRMGELMAQNLPVVVI